MMICYEIKSPAMHTDAKTAQHEIVNIQHCHKMLSYHKYNKRLVMHTAKLTEITKSINTNRDVKREPENR